MTARNTGLLRSLSTPAMTFALLGCVTTGKFQEQVDKTTAMQARATDDEDLLKTAEKTIAQSKADLAKAKTDADAAAKAGADQIAALQAQIATLQKSNKDLTDASSASKSDLQKKLADLIKDKDTLSQNLTDLTKKTGDQINDLTQKLSQAQADRDVLQHEKDVELAAMKKNMDDAQAALKTQIDQGNIQISELKGKLTLNLGDKVLFQRGQSDMNEAARKVLDQVGDVLANMKDKDIRIEGYTDNTPLGGTLKERYPSNWELSAARAAAVARYLQESGKVDPKRLVVTGYGEFRPVAPNDTPENQSKNRHIEIVLIPHD